MRKRSKFRGHAKAPAPPRLAPVCQELQEIALELAVIDARIVAINDRRPVEVGDDYDGSVISSLETTIINIHKEIARQVILRACGLCVD